MMGVPCPECEFLVKIGSRVQDGQRFVCPNCRTTFIIRFFDDESDDFELIRVSNHPKKRLVIEAGCPECESTIRLNANVREGQPVTCQHCLAELEVVSVDPLEVDFAIPVPLKKNRYRKADKLPAKSRKSRG